MRSPALLLLAALAVAQSPLAHAAEPAPAAKAAKQIQVGDTLPAATLRTVEDQKVGLRELVAEKPTVLIFYRGGWCPYCVRHLGALGEISPKIIESGFQILAVSPDQPSKLRAKPAMAELSYTLLSDSSAEAIRALGIAFRVPDELVAKYKADYGIDLEADSGQTHHLLPHPAVFVVNRAGVVRFAHVNPDYRVRLDPEHILSALEEAKN